MADRQQKQAYLRQHVDMDQYEDFAQYCQNEAGEIDIDKWSFSFVKQLVQKFKAFKQKQDNQQSHQRSFANYQTADIQQVYSIVTAVQNTQHEQIMASQCGQLPKSQVNNIQTNQSVQPQPQRKKSAFDLLDSVFQQQGSQSSINSLSPNSNQSPPNKVQQQQSRQNSKISAFQSGNIWATSSNIQTTNKKSQFDHFWEFPDKNNQAQGKGSSGSNNNQSQFRTDNINIQQYQQPQPQQQNQGSMMKKKQSSLNPKSQQQVPSYEQLTRKLNMSKKSAPHITQAQKPSNMKKQQSTHVKFQTNKNKKVQQTNSHIKLISQKPIKPILGSTASAYKMNKVPYTGPSVHKKQFTDTVKCYEAVFRPQLNDRNLAVTIDKHQIVQRNFFVSDYVMYSLTVKPMGIVVKRNYQDFTKLRASLQKVYPATQLPYLEKNSWFETNLQNIKKQKCMLEFFINDLIKNPQMKNSRILQDFLTLKEHKAVKRKFEQYAKMDKFKGLQQLCVMNGKVQVVVNETQRIYHDQLGKFLNSVDDLLERKRKLTQTLGDQFAAVNNTLTLLSKLSANLGEQVKKFNQRVSDYEIPSLQNTFSILTKSYQQWASRICFESKVVNKRLTPFYRYQKDNISTLQQHLDRQNSLLKGYQKRSAYENSNNGEIYSSSKLDQYKVGVLQESKNVTILKYQLGYSGNMLCQQTVRFFEQMSDNFKGKWIYKAEKYKERFSKDLQFYGSITAMAQ